MPLSLLGIAIANARGKPNVPDCLIHQHHHPCEQLTIWALGCSAWSRWGILHASAAAALARTQQDDYELLGVSVPKELGQMASVGKSREIPGAPFAVISSRF